MKTPKRVLIVLGMMLALAGLLAAPPCARAQTFRVLHSFSGSDGASPWAGLVMDSSGNLYGTTDFGGSNACVGGCGTVFKLDTSGRLTVLHRFSGSDGASPTTDLVIDSSGNLYGTTGAGGSSDCAYYGCGTVFKLDTSGTLTVLHSFSGFSDGGWPYAGLVMDSSGNLYGMTVTGWGGSNACLLYGCGTVFKLDTSGSGFTVLHVIAGYPPDGGLPSGALVIDSSGNLYGTTLGGGAFSNACGGACGTVFKLDTSRRLTVLHSFSGGDGANPYGGLVLDTSGNLYGTTVGGGSDACFNRCGTVFKLDTSGNGFTVLHSFSGSDGQWPYGGLALDSSGNLYGTTAANGTVFKLDTSGNNFTVLHRFASSDGSWPLSRLAIDSSGNLYGTASMGGSSNQGTVFEISTTPQAATRAIIAQVNVLHSQGVLNRGQDNSLTRHLQKAIELMDAGNYSGAINKLEDFIHEVKGLENSRKLTSDQASSLVAAATSVIEQLQMR